MKIQVQSCMHFRLSVLLAVTTRTETNQKQNSNKLALCMPKCSFEDENITQWEDSFCSATTIIFFLHDFMLKFPSTVMGNEVFIYIHKHQILWCKASSNQAGNLLTCVLAGYGVRQSIFPQNPGSLQDVVHELASYHSISTTEAMVVRRLTAKTTPPKH